MSEMPEHVKRHLHSKEQRARSKQNVRTNLSKSTRTMVGDDGEALIAIWWAIANDPMRRDADRLRATELLADRGWGKAASFTPQEGDPLGLEDAEEAAAEFRRRVLRLASGGDEGTASGGVRGAEPSRS
jgi:hypothetical protein